MNRALVSIIFVLLAAVLILNCGNAEKEASKTISEVSTLPSLQALLDNKKAEFTKNAPEEMQKLFEEGLRELAASGVLESALNMGDMAPDFELPNAVGQTIRLSEILKSNPVILTWYRGGW